MQTIDAWRIRGRGGQCGLGWPIARGISIIRRVERRILRVESMIRRVESTISRVKPTIRRVESSRSRVESSV